MQSSRKLTVILHADIAGSTMLVQQHESIAHARMQDAFQRFASVIEAYNGVALEIRGDALLADFARVSDAVAASITFQQQNQQVNYAIEDDIKPVLRIGISMGEVVVADNTITGEGVVIAQRIEQLAEAGGICIQGTAQDTLLERLPYECSFISEQKLKGLRKPVRYFSVALKPGEAVPKPEPLTDLDPIAADIEYTSSIAVLPLDNMSGDPDQQYFTDGMTEDIITTLSRFHDLHVTARNSSSVYRGKATDVREVGRDLGVHYVLEGSVRKLGDRVRVTVQLIDALSGNHLWAERYDRRLEDVFAVQDEITEMVVSTLAIRVESDALSRARRKPIRNQDAYDLVLRGDNEIVVYTRDGSDRAKKLFFNAIEIDPNCARAYVGIAYCFLSDWGYCEGSTTETLWRAVDFARIAVALDDSHSRSHWVLAYVLTLNREYDEAEVHMQKALAMNPNDADVIAKMGYILPLIGDCEKGIEVAEKAMRLNPYHPEWYKTFVGFAYYTGRRYEDAIAAFNRSGNLYRDDIVWKVAALAQLDRIDEAEAIMRKLLDEAGEHPWWQDVFSSEIKVEPDRTGMLTYMYHMYPFNNSEDCDHLLDGLRKAGL
jgi:adenylate cyclase